MSIRFTEEDAIKAGWKKDAKGNWSKVSVSSAHPRQVSKLESGAQQQKKGSHGSQGEDVRGREEGNGGSSGAPGVRGASRAVHSDQARYRIVVTAYCRRDTDPDNLCPKWFVDRLKEFGVMPDDSSVYVSEFVKRVVKIENWQPEQTMIEVFEDGDS